MPDCGRLGLVANILNRRDSTYMEQSENRAWPWVIVVMVILIGAVLLSWQDGEQSAVLTPTPSSRLAPYLGPVQGDCDVRITEDMTAKLTGEDIGDIMYLDGCTREQAQEIIDDFTGISAIATAVMEDIKANPTEWAIMSRAGEVMDDVRDILEPFLADGELDEWERSLICDLPPAHPASLSSWQEALRDGMRVELERGNVGAAERYEEGEAVVMKALEKC